jgi:hypothetical protein
VEKERISGWERSKISTHDHRMLKNLGIFKKEAMRMLGDESAPRPSAGFRVTFVDFIIEGSLFLCMNFSTVSSLSMESSFTADPKLSTPCHHLHHLM